MMRFEPTLTVSRLVVLRNDNIVYDEAFHLGVNIVRGENASGKSTVLNFIYYGLGGDLADWSAAALLCTSVWVEVQMNGLPATFVRDISQSHGQPMNVFFGSMDDARKSSVEAWTRYPYKRSENRESFSQAIFRLLGIPEVSSETSGNITMHQFLRLLYADQLSPVEEIFKSESFDSPAQRDTIGRLLVGAYDSQIYANEIRIRALSKEYDEVSGELRSLLAIAGQNGESVTRSWIEAERSVLRDRERVVQQEIEAADQELYAAKSLDEITLASQRATYADFQLTQSNLLSAENEISRIEFAIADSDLFILSLDRKLVQLEQSSSVAESLGLTHYYHCPACFSSVASEPESAHCSLCKTPFNSDDLKTRLASLISETSNQLRQSKVVQAARRKKLEFALQSRMKLQSDWEQLSVKLGALQKLPSSELKSRTQALLRESGYLQRQLEDLTNKEKIATLVAAKSERKAELSGTIDGLKSENEVLRSSQQKRLQQAQTVISEEVKTILRNDLRREQAFENPKSIQFSFGSNKISVDGESYFSASSRVILKSSFILGLFSAALKIDFFRHPRFVMIDTIEDKGMEPQRSHNFQMEVRRVSENSKVEHQIIFATAMIAPDLDDDVHTVGAFSTRDEYTLKVTVQ